jgi:hypothetical protein
MFTGTSHGHLSILCTFSPTSGNFPLCVGDAKRQFTEIVEKVKARRNLFIDIFHGKP